MGGSLTLVENWTDLAEQARYRCDLLAIAVGIGERQLERFFTERFHQSPKKWMQQQRMTLACNLLVHGYSTKAVAHDLFFSSAAHFCTEFKKQLGLAPQHFVRATKCRLFATMSAI